MSEPIHEEVIIPAHLINIEVDEPCDPPEIIDSLPETVVYDEQGRMIWPDEEPSDELIRTAMRGVAPDEMPTPDAMPIPIELGGEGGGA